MYFWNRIENLFEQSSKPTKFKLKSNALSMPSALLSMELQPDFDLELNSQIPLSNPPDINLPLFSEPDSSHPYDVKAVGRKCAKRVDSVWGAWFFYSFYFKPVLNDKSKANVSRFDKSDLNHDVFMVQHDMENMYMWVFKDRPENSLGKMQLRSYMNGHSRQGERPFPFSADKGFVRSHRMQRKHYRGLSNPQCIHGIEFVPSPNLTGFGEEEQRRWTELTGRGWNFTVPPEASDFSSWRNLAASLDFELERLPSLVKTTSKKMELSPESSKKRKALLYPNGIGNKDDCYLAINPLSDANTVSDGPSWLNEFSGVMKNVYGPVTAAKTIYEDEESYLIIISLPCVDLQRVKVSWRNTVTHGIIKVSGVSTSRMPFVKRRDKIFRLADPSSEHCPPGEFVREIPLSTRIVEDASIEAYYDGLGSALEIVVPKLQPEHEEHEIRVCFHRHLGAKK